MIICILPFLIVLPDISYKYLGKNGFPNPLDDVCIKDAQEVELINKDEQNAI